MKHYFLLLLLCVVSVFPIAAQDLLYSRSGSVEVIIVQHGGLFVSTDAGLTWHNRSDGLPVRQVYPEYGNGIKTFSALAVGAVDTSGAVILAATTDALYRSTDAGLHWEAVSLGKPVKSADYFTSVAGHPVHRNTILLGTSYSGLLETTDGGASWRRLESRLKPLYRGAGFYEEILGLAYEKTPAAAEGEDPFSPVCTTGFTKESYRFTGGSIEKTAYVIPEKPSERSIENLYSTFPAYKGKTYESHTDVAAVYLDRKGIYVNAIQAGSDALDFHLDFLMNKGMDSIVIDFKDDNGLVTYDTSLSFPRSIGAVRERIQLDRLVEKVHTRGMYLIARIVVFKDPKLYAQPGYPIMDAKGGTWGHRVKTEKDGETVWEQKEFWVDPFHPGVWDYNASIARELQERGVDEIQFDYIRFPSDGDTSRAVYPSRREGMTRIEALESFLVRVREEIHIPVSTDLYGFNSWYRMGNWIGQSLNLVARYVDVICPMFYPSHFPRDFLSGLEYKARAERIYREGCDRASAIVDGHAVIRPYIQAFLLPFEYYMEKPEYTEYLRLQVKGTNESAASGFLLWNNSNRYYMVSDAIREYTVKAGEGEKKPDTPALD